MAELRQYDIAGAAMQGFQQGRAIRNQNQLNQLASQAYSTAPEGQNALLGQIAQISPQAAAAQQQQFQQGEERTGNQLRGLVQYVNKARATKDPRQVNAALASAGPFIQRLTGKAPPTEWTPDMDAGWAQLEAQVAMQGGSSAAGGGVQSTYVDGDGKRVAIMRDGTTQILGDNDTGATQQTISINGPDGRPAQYTFDRRTGNYVPAGAGMVAPQAAPQVSRFTAPDGVQVDIGADIDPAMRESIMQYERSLGAVPDGTQVQMPDRQVQQFSGGNQFRNTQAVVPGPSQFVGQSPAERAQAEAAAKAGVELQYAPAMRAIQTQGALDQARGEAQIQTDSTIQRDDAKIQAERARNLPQLQEQRRVLTDALQGLGTKYRTGPVNAVIPDALQSADNQVFMTVVNNAVLDAASKLTGVISDKDMEFLRRATVNLDSREDANREILRRQLRILDEGIEKAQRGVGSRSRQAPQPGAVQDGYRFRGGNPADPNSWERI